MSEFPDQSRSFRGQSLLAVGALGVVFGDIGTSPLYTVKECLAHLPAGTDATEGVLGVLSLMFWSLVLVVCAKYLFFVMRADNQGEGGIFALLAMLHAGREAPRSRALGATVIMILVGAALLYGDGIITPAISVLGAAEGFIAISPDFQRAVPWIAAVILGALFWFQHLGTRRIGAVFGPVMIVWFAVLAVLGCLQIAQYPAVLRAFNPIHCLPLMRHHPGEVSALLGAIVLVITGTEALYADMGHFGRKAITLAWYGAAFPALAMNYFGQGAYILSHPGSRENPFFAMAAQGLPRALLTALSIVAAVIASQALISGAYSLTRQAIQLGYFPRLKIVYTNPDQSGQIYVPFVNGLLLLGCVMTVAVFGSTDRLAAAYGIAVTGTMAITTVAYFLVTQRRWKQPLWLAAPICAVFLIVDGAFFGANTPKIAEGGWFPLAIGAAILAVMHAWKTGRDEVYRRVYGVHVTDSDLIGIADSSHISRVAGSAVFMVGSPRGTPVALLHHVKANRSLHKTVVLLSIITEEVPAVDPKERLLTFELGEGIWRVVGRYGYMESPNVRELLNDAAAHRVPIKPEKAVYFFNREMIIAGGSSRMWTWEKHLYGFLSRNARPAKDYYQLPPSQIIEVGLPVEL